MNADFKKVTEKISNDGYCIIPGVFSDAQIEKARSLVLECYNERPDGDLENIPYLNRDQQMVYNLQNKHHYFLALLFSSELLQKLLIHFLNDIWYKQIPLDQPNYILRAYLARSSNTPLPLHIDSFVPYKSEHPFVMQAAIILEDQTIENGCTLVVPGSHRTGEYARQEAMEEAVPIESRAGDIVLWDSRLWHGAGKNNTSSTRWSLIATFARWWIKQNFDIPGNLPAEIYNQLSNREKAVLGFCSTPFNDETEGIDIRKGYADLKEKM